MEDTVGARLGETKTDECESSHGHACADGEVPVRAIVSDVDVG